MGVEYVYMGVEYTVYNFYTQTEFALIFVPALYFWASDTCVRANSP